MDTIEKYVLEAINKKNASPTADFEGYSPNEMQYILYDVFHSKSPIVIRNTNQSIYQKVPIFNQIKFLLDPINNNKRIFYKKNTF